MIRHIEIYRSGESDWSMQVHRVNGESALITNWSSDHPKLLADLMALAESIKTPNEIALDKVLGVVAESATVEQLAEIKDIFPEWQNGIEVKKNQILQFGNKLYRSLQAHTAEQTPDVTKALWSEIGLDEASGADIIEWYEPDSERNYKLDQLVRYTDGKVYKSLLEANVWSPESFPRGWQKIESEE